MSNLSGDFLAGAICGLLMGFMIGVWIITGRKTKKPNREIMDGGGCRVVVGGSYTPRPGPPPPVPPSPQKPIAPAVIILPENQTPPRPRR